MIRAFILLMRFYFSPTVKNWRALRKVCMAQLPKLPPAPTKPTTTEA